MSGIDPALFRKARQGDKSARDLIFSTNTGLIWACIKRYSGLLEQEDLFQLGAIGLIKSIERFDPDLGFAFATFAVPHITGEIRRYLRDNTPVKIERRLKELAFKARRYQNSTLLLTGKEPSLREVAEGIGVEADVLLEALEATAPLKYFDEIQEDRPVEVPQEDNSREAFEIQEAVSNLDEPMKTIILGRFFKGETQSELAKKLGVSQAHVSRLEKRALLLLRSSMQAEKGISV
jgi:RNA polymerase sporulation-specific sigma factor